jgi:WS/DGAT/MGAT family acyltransferase
VRFDDVTTLRRVFGGTVNDIVVAAVTRAFRELLLGRGETVDRRTVAALVPVSLRAPGEHGQPDNRVADVHALLPVGIDDPIAALRAIHEHLDDLKTSHEVDASGALMRLGDLVPRALADRIARAVVRRANVETAVTNVPGPRSPLFFCGRRMLEAYPFAPIAGPVRITVAVWSYCDHIFFGVTGDRETAGDLDRVATGIETGFAALLDEAAGTSR